MPAPSGTYSAFLDGLSCASTQFCLAVGGNIDFADPAEPVESALSESWNGARWVARQLSKPAGAVDTILTDVSCASADACTAIGVYTTAKYKVLPLVEVWNGQQWTPRPAPAHGGLGVSLISLSCASATACLTVGDYRTTTNQTVLADLWDGRAWRHVSPSSGAQVSQITLSGISCVSARACMAVGTTATATTLAEWWNGSSWSITPTSQP